MLTVNIIHALIAAKLAKLQQALNSDWEGFLFIYIFFSLLPLGIFIRMILRMNVPINRNTAKIAHTPGCTGVELDGSRAKLARNAPVALHG